MGLPENLALTDTKCRRSALAPPPWRPSSIHNPITFLNSLSFFQMCPRRGVGVRELSRNFRILGRFEGHGITAFSPRQGDAAKAIAYTCVENFEGEEKTQRYHIDLVLIVTGFPENLVLTDTNVGDRFSGVTLALEFCSESHHVLEQP